MTSAKERKRPDRVEREKRAERGSGKKRERGPG